MKETSVLLGPVITGAVMSGVLSILFIAQERYKARKERVRYARLIVVELNRISDIVRPLPWARYDSQTNHLAGQLPRNAYDGLAASAMISVFDTNLQRQLHTSYDNMASRRYAYLRSNVMLLLADMHGFRSRNARRLIFFLWRREGA